MISQNDLSESIKKTQKALGTYVKKPALTEKLLSKPPFRFLHDVVTTIIKSTGFLKGLFTESELNSENVKDKESKIAFLTKLIDAIRHIGNVQLTVRPTKIVAGLEPIQTNLLLQAIANAIRSGLDSTNYVQQLRNENLHPGSKDRERKQRKVAKQRPKEDQTKGTSEQRSSTLGVAVKEAGDAPDVVPIVIKEKNLDPGDTEKNGEVKRRHTSRYLNNSTKPETVRDKTVTRTRHKMPINQDSQEKDDRDKSGGKRTKSQTRINNINSANTEITQVALNQKSHNSIQSNDKVSNHVQAERNHQQVLKSAANEEKPIRRPSPSRSSFTRKKPNETVNEEPLKSKVSSHNLQHLRPPSVRPVSAKPGAPRLRPDSALQIKDSEYMGKIRVIVDGQDKDDEDNETVVVQNHVKEDNVEPILNLSTQNKGHLVEQILEQISTSNEQIEKKDMNDDSEWHNEYLRGDSIKKEISNLMSVIQTLTKNANPLGKLLYYLHEDIEAMQNELNSLTIVRRKLITEIRQQQSKISEQNRPILDDLDNVNQQIKKHENEIANCKSTILKNENKIKNVFTLNN